MNSTSRRLLIAGLFMFFAGAGVAVAGQTVTVLRMVRAFNEISQSDAPNRPAELAEGISRAVGASRIGLLIGGVTGGTVGVQIIKILRELGNADFLIKITYVLMLGLVGSYMFLESLQAMRKKKAEQEPAAAKESRYARLVGKLPWQTDFETSGVRLSVLMPLGLGVFVGILAAIMGVGGGFIMVPVMVYLLRMPMHVVVGTSLFQILFTCINVTILQAYSNHTVDFVLALILLLGSTLGAQFGAKISKRLGGEQLKILLASIVLLVMVKMLFSLLLTPDVMVAYKGGH